MELIKILTKSTVIVLITNYYHRNYINDRSDKVHTTTTSITLEGNTFITDLIIIHYLNKIGEVNLNCNLPLPFSG